MEEKIFCGSGYQRGEYYTSVNLCLSDIPKEDITEYNGKKYIKLTLGKRKNPGDRGQTHWLAIDRYKKQTQQDDIGF